MTLILHAGLRAGRGCHWMVQACLAVFPLDVYLHLGDINALTRRKPLVVYLFLGLPYVSFNNVPYVASVVMSAPSSDLVMKAVLKSTFRPSVGPK